MIHPSYSELMNVINSEVEPGEQPPVQSRYSIELLHLREQDRLLTVLLHMLKAKARNLYQLQ